MSSPQIWTKEAGVSNLAGRGYLMTMRADGKEMRIDQVEASPKRPA